MKRRERTFTGSLSQEVTERETVNRALARIAAAEGFVLLMNEEQVLPLKKGSAIALYGAGATQTVKGGIGSGDVNERDCVSIFQGIDDAGFDIANRAWLEKFDSMYKKEKEAWRDRLLKIVEETGEHFFDIYAENPFLAPTGDLPDAETMKADGADTALFVLSRIAGEGADRKEEAGDYYLTDVEKNCLEQLNQCYETILVVVNTGGLVDLEFTENYSHIKAIVQMMQAGQEGGHALADMLTGDVTPSGKLTDTWPKSYHDYPTAETFSYKDGDIFHEKYTEGIYVGYRYFDTFEVPVRYSFGYGLSYTSFEIETKGIAVSGKGTTKPMLEVTVTVTNSGSTVSGKEVVQIYASCPQKKMEKEFRRLTGFAKTKLLAPGESQTLTIGFPLYQLTSYCEKCASWVLEAGSYGIWVGNSLMTSVLSATMELGEDTVVTECTNICERKEALDEIHPDQARLAARSTAWIAEALKKKVPAVAVAAKDIVKETISYAGTPETFPGKAGEIVETLSVDQLIDLATGDPGKGQGSTIGSAGLTVPGAAAETSSSAVNENVASIVLADGPAGLRLNQYYNVVDGSIVGRDFLASIEGGFFAGPYTNEGTRYYQYLTAIPVGTLLAQSWDVELIRTIGEMIGKEMELFEVTLWLAPGMNIHRNPLCGRNFEYYSEDPLLAGLIAGAMTEGVQRVPGCGTTIKHFACNSQEDNRMGSDSILSERALREIYLKGFEIAVKDSQPMSIMTSYNLINGVHAANNRDLCTKAAREEWGFAGSIMTDWGTTNNSTAGISTAAGCMRAGNDMVMPGQPEDHENLRAELADGSLLLKDLKNCVAHTINTILQSNQYEDAVSYSKQFQGLGTYLTVK